MMHHGGPSPKRTWLWSNMPEISQLDHGVLPKQVRDANTTVKTTRTYRDGKGKVRFVGTSGLSQSQNLDLYNCMRACIYSSTHEPPKLKTNYFLPATIPGHIRSSLARTCCKPSRITSELVLCVVTCGLNHSTIGDWQTLPSLNFWD